MEVDFAELWKAVSSRVTELRNEKTGNSDRHLSEEGQFSPVYDAWLLPFQASKTQFKQWDKEFIDEIGRAGIAEKRIPIFFAMAYYGDDQEMPSVETWKKLVAFVEDWNDKYQLQPDRWGLADFVFCYALGIGRQLPRSAEPNIWEKHWPAAHHAFDLFVLNMEDKLQDKLEENGVRDTGVNLQIGETNTRGSRSTVLLEILLEDVPCPCADSYLKRHPKAKKDTVEKRHQREHRMEAWFDQTGWPGKKTTFWPNYFYVFRACFGEQPYAWSTSETGVNIKLSSLDKGLMFECLEPQPEVFTALVCDEVSASPTNKKRKCGKFVDDIGYCPQCKTTNPRIELSENRLRAPEDPSWKPIKVRRCVGCGRCMSTEAERLCHPCATKKSKLSKLDAPTLIEKWNAELDGDAEWKRKLAEWERGPQGNNRPKKPKRKLSTDASLLSELLTEQHIFHEDENRISSADAKTSQAKKRKRKAGNPASVSVYSKIRMDAETEARMERKRPATNPKDACGVNADEVDEPSDDEPSDSVYLSFLEL